MVLDSSNKHNRHHHDCLVNISGATDTRSNLTK